MFERIISGLVNAGVRFVVIGGVAGTMQGSTRLTNDIDICYESTPDNMKALAGVLASWGAYLRGVERGLPFIMDERTLRTTPTMTLTTQIGNIDVMDRVAGVGGYARALAGSEAFMVGNTAFRALSLTSLISAKRAANRAKDQEHLLELEALEKMRGDKK